MRSPTTLETTSLDRVQATSVEEVPPMKSARAITTCLVTSVGRTPSATSPITTSLRCTSMVPHKDAVVASEAIVAVDQAPTSTRLVLVTSSLEKTTET